ncbi:chemotaxis protein CheA [Corallococcus sp. M34]|uniref:chemotaxis protein CheA n=1 Tax=Citreicoccus inhibens TaxID=2849499 RepID=UPI001C24F1F9|nr:chemotaxis protein CheA [Citreicoccus inhibens]MBU8898995.1 chemotaxis protein CheA [Citreicoccus inhibens]
MTMDMSRYLGLFISEASEHLEALSRDLVQLEREGSSSAVDSMFRHAHSVKGMASSMGFEPIAILAHRVEDLVDAVRQDRSRLDRDLVDLLLSSADALLAQVRAVADNKEPAEATALLQQLSARVTTITGHAPATTRVARVTVLKPAATTDAAAEPPANPEPAAAAKAPEASAPAPDETTRPPGAKSAPADPRPGSSAGGLTSGAGAEAGAAAREPRPAESLAHDVAARPAPGLELSGGLQAAAGGALASKPEGEARAPLQRWAVQLRIAPTCQVPGVRAFLVHKRLTTLGTLLDLRPALEELKAGRIPDGYIQVELETSVGDTGIHSALRNVAEVEVVSVKAAVAAPAPAPPAAAAPDSARASAEAGGSRTVRVRTELLDYFLDTVGELMLATARLREVGKVLPENARPELEEGVYRLHTLVKDLHDKVMSARMTPLSLITDRLPRAARDLARRKEREVDLVITGAEIELDRAILDELADPLLHLLRNCIDHGLEAPEERLAAKKGSRGRVLVAVRRARDRVIVEIEDDGRGMDPAKLKAAAVTRGLLAPEAAARLTDREAFLLSCLPGVSTAKDVTDISGRGVGMDAVKRVVESVGGTLEIDSERGRGTRFTLRLPLTVAVVHLLLVEVGDEVFGLPIAKVVGATEADGETLSRSRETALLPHGNGLLPVHALDALLGVPAPVRRGLRPFVVMDGDSGKVALAVDRLLGQEEVVLKPLSRPLDLLPGLSGVTILGSGRPVFILDVPRLLSA